MRTEGVGVLSDAVLENYLSEKRKIPKKGKALSMQVYWPAFPPPEPWLWSTNEVGGYGIDVLGGGGGRVDDDLISTLDELRDEFDLVPSAEVVDFVVTM